SYQSPGSPVVICASSATSKPPDGRPDDPKMTFAGIGLSFTWTPIDFSSSLAIASDVARTELPDVHDQLIVAGRPWQVQTFVFPGSTDDGPPVQFFAISASAFCGLKFHFWKSGV